MAASRFVWHDLMSTDVARGAAFYAQLFGWTTSTFDMGAYGTYTMLKNGAMDIGGVLPIDKRLGLRTLWLAYVNVPSVEGTMTRVLSLGGKVLVPSSEIPNVGRYAIVADRQGAIMSPFTRLGGDNPEPDDAPPPGAFAWDELLTSDLQQAAAFYASLFRWRAEASGARQLLKRGTKDSAGVSALSPGVSKSPIWVPHVAVESVDDAALRAERLKARVVARAERFAILADPLGALLAVSAR
jgi:predicted enzyme related to lactoylglutathione lyase